jgi:hypothetical protein
MMSGSRLEKVSLLRSIGGFHGVQACSGVFWTPYYFSPGPGWFLESLLSEVFAWW